MITPLKPQHADRETPVGGAPGFAVRRVLEGYAYPQNGNVHNPTPRYRFLLLLDGRTVDSSHSDRELRHAAKAPNARRDYSATPTFPSR
jgi:hypothetical protein